MASLRQTAPRATQSYTFAAQPQPVGKYRQPQVPGNMAQDRRVVRGGHQARGGPRKARPQPAVVKPSTPEPVDGREHIEIQTEQYLEEITDRLIEVDIETQTDPFLDRPESPAYIPQKQGVDCETQIEEGELFDFDFEAEPLLEVLIGKTLEQSLMEVLEEQELTNMRKHQAEFEQRRNAELAETQRMEAAERRKIEEKKRRIEQEKIRLEEEKKARKKLAASRFAEQYLNELQDRVFDHLTEEGLFFDPVLKEVQESFVPWALEEMEQKMAEQESARMLLDDILRHALESGMRQRAEAVMVKEEKAVRKGAQQIQDSLARLYADKTESDSEEESDEEDEDEY